MNAKAFGVVAVVLLMCAGLCFILTVYLAFPGSAAGAENCDPGPHCIQYSYPPSEDCYAPDFDSPCPTQSSVCDWTGQCTFNQAPLDSTWLLSAFLFAIGCICSLCALDAVRQRRKLHPANRYGYVSEPEPSDFVGEERRREDEEHDYDPDYDYDYEPHNEDTG